MGARNLLVVVDFGVRALVLLLRESFGAAESTLLPKLADATPNCPGHTYLMT
jgi:hypothetical protein